MILSCPADRGALDAPWNRIISPDIGRSESGDPPTAGIEGSLLLGEDVKLPR